MPARFASPLATAVLCMLLPTVVGAGDIFVNNLGGSDRADGSSATRLAQQGGPVRTIARALQLATAGDRIILANNDEPYRESISLMGPRNSGIGGDPFFIVGNGAMLDGTAPVPETAWQHVRDDVYRFQPHGLAYQVLYNDGRPLRQHPVSKVTPALPKLKPLEWCLYDAHVYFRTHQGKHPLDYKLSHSELSTGITLYSVQNVVIADLVVQGYRYDGLCAADRCSDIRLTRVTLRGNGRSGLSVNGASFVTLDHSLLGDNGTAQIRVEYPGRLLVEQSEVLANTAPRYVRHDEGKILIDGQPPPAE